MKRAIPPLVLALALALGAIDCSKNSLGVDEDQIKNLGTMTAVTDGRVWSAKDPEGHSTAFGTLYVSDAGDTMLQLVGPCYNSGDTLSSAIVMNLHGAAEATFPLRDLHVGQWHVSRCQGPDTLHGHWTTDQGHGGAAMISKIDASKGNVTGVFSFAAFRGDSQATVTITNGRFDLPYTVEHTPSGP